MSICGMKISNEHCFVAHTTLFLASYFVQETLGQSSSFLGSRLTSTCLGYTINQTIKCVQCHSLCLTLYLQDEKDQHWDGVRINPTNTKCEQILTSAESLICFYKEPQDNENGMVLKPGRLNGHVNEELYFGIYGDTFHTFLPITNASLEPISMPKYTFTTVDTQSNSVVFDHGYLICEYGAIVCAHWKFGLSHWEPFPSPTTLHKAGGMVLFGGEPFITAGKDSSDADTDVSEIFDKTTKTWIPGPSLSPARHSLCLLEANYNTVVAIGGVIVTETVRVDKLVKGDFTWTQVTNRPQAAYGIICGVVTLSGHQRGALTIGGRPVSGGFRDTAYFLDFVSWTWSRVSNFDAPKVAIFGSLVQWRSQIHLFPLEEEVPGGHSTAHYVKDLAESGQSWTNRNTLSNYPKAKRLSVKVISKYGLNG